MLQQFAAQYIEGKPDPTGQYASYCKFFLQFWAGQRGIVNGVRAWNVVASAYPSNSDYGNEIVRTEAEINQAKARVRFQTHSFTVPFFFR